jgi:hypothetical protein
VAEPFSGKGFYTFKALNRDFAVEMKKIFERKCKGRKEGAGTMGSGVYV